mgnify:CR=1 FL=1
MAERATSVVVERCRGPPSSPPRHHCSHLQYVCPARQVQPDALGMHFGGIAGLVAVTRNQGKKRDASEITTDEGLGRQFGSGRRVIALTSRRFLMWGHPQLSGKPLGLEAAIPLDYLVSVSHQKGKVVTSSSLRSQKAPVHRGPWKARLPAHTFFLTTCCHYGNMLSVIKE